MQGASLTSFKRLIPAQYENGFNAPLGWDPNKLYNGFALPNARKVSQEIIKTTDITEDDSISHMVCNMVINFFSGGHTSNTMCKMAI